MHIVCIFPYINAYLWYFIQLYTHFIHNNIAIYKFLILLLENFSYYFWYLLLENFDYFYINFLIIYEFSILLIKLLIFIVNLLYFNGFLLIFYLNMISTTTLLEFLVAFFWEKYQLFNMKHIIYKILLNYSVFLV